MKRKDILIILIPSLIVVILWVIFSVFHNYINSTIPNDINMQILSINPDFDTDTINKIKSRSTIDPIYTFEQSTVDEASLDENPSPTPSVNPPTVSTSSAKIASDEGALE